MRAPAKPSVLLVNLYFPPDTSATAPIFSDLLNSFARAGYVTTALCGRPSYRPRERRPWRPLLRERSAQVDVERVGSTAFERGPMSLRVANYVSYTVLASLRGLFRARPQLVISGSDPPLAILVALIAARGAPVLYHLQDLHPEAAISGGWITDGHAARIWERVHRFGLLRARLVVCLAETMRTRVEQKGVSPNQIMVVPNGARRPSTTPRPERIDLIRGGARFVAIHAGNIGVAGAWETLGIASTLVGDHIELVFVGDGAKEAEVRGHGLRVLPYQRDVAAVMAAGDVQLVTLRRGMEGLVVPSKVYEALAHGRPVLAVAPDTAEIARIVRAWRCGMVVAPEEPADVARALQDLHDDRRRLAAMAENARRAGEYYERGSAFDKLVERVSRQLLTPRSPHHVP